MVAQQIAAALATAHQQGIVRRDLKPGNIEVGEDGTVKVLDFGLAWPIEQQYRELKNDLSLEYFEGSSYQGWTHRVALTPVAFTFLQIERGRTSVDLRSTLPVVRGWVREILRLLYVTHNRRRLSMLDSFRRNAPLRR